MRSTRFANAADPGAALLAFSRSFKKVRRTRTSKPRRHLLVARQTLKRVRSLPNLNELSESLANKVACSPDVLRVSNLVRRRRYNSLFVSALQLPSSALVLQEGNYFAKDYLAVHRNNTSKVNGGPHLHIGTHLPHDSQLHRASNSVENKTSSKINVCDVYQQKVAWNLFLSSSGGIYVKSAVFLRAWFRFSWSSFLLRLSALETKCILKMVINRVRIIGRFVQFLQ